MSWATLWIILISDNKEPKIPPSPPPKKKVKRKSIELTRKVQILWYCAQKMSVMRRNIYTKLIEIIISYIYASITIKYEYVIRMSVCFHVIHEPPSAIQIHHHHALCNAFQNTCPVLSCLQTNLDTPFQIPNGTPIHPKIHLLPPSRRGLLPLYFNYTHVLLPHTFYQVVMVSETKN